MITLARLKTICTAMAEAGDEEVAPVILALISVAEAAEESVGATLLNDWSELEKALAGLEPE